MVHILFHPDEFRKIIQGNYRFNIRLINIESLNHLTRGIPVVEPERLYPMITSTMSSQWFFKIAECSSNNCWSISILFKRISYCLGIGSMLLSDQCFCQLRISIKRFGKTPKIVNSEVILCVMST